MTRYWIGVASKDHVQVGVRDGFCQFDHGKEAPVKRLERGDRIVYYAPRERMGAGSPVQAFVAIGRVDDETPYRVSSVDGFQPFRRKVHYFRSREAPIAALLPRLSFTRGKASWGFGFRRGFFEIESDDYRAIADAMHVSS